MYTVAAPEHQAHIYTILYLWGPSCLNIPLDAEIMSIYA